MGIRTSSVLEDAQKKAESAGQKASDISNSLEGIRQGLTSSRLSLSNLEQTATTIKGQYEQLQLDVTRYRQVNEKIEEVQREPTLVKEQVVDLGNRRLRANAIETTGAGPGSIGFGAIGCRANCAEYISQRMKSLTERLKILPPA